MTTKTLDWLNQNRFRAYPFVNDDGLIVGGKRIPDCIVLDCLVVDTRHISHIPKFKFVKFDIRSDKTIVYFKYDDVMMSYEIQDRPITNDDETYVKITGKMIAGAPSQFVSINMTFSAHRYIIERVGVGTWSFDGTVYPSKVVSVTASGVSGITTNGSYLVQPGGTASGHVHLVDGYRTQPVIKNNKVYVKVGNAYGFDPCHYPREEETGKVPCDDMMFFFCGQNAVNSGNVVLSGGPGVSIQQGRYYTAKEDILDTYGNIGIRKGEKVPCIEVIAASELLRIYRPSETWSSSDSGSSPEE